ncbi:unnamed protein product [Mycena citricolor]|uniref:Uncharacterized protein n=1 Tax=Mycena citricolor TaxID=2018698 RepID=A0AAD2H7J5_9AGAR|nr:unnamed protein product [Mycena citricolor]
MSGLAPTLPLELQYLVINAVHATSSTYRLTNVPFQRLLMAGIRPDVLSLRLVCLSWHDYTSQTLLRLFKDITLRNDSHAARFCTLVRMSPRAGIRVQSLVVKRLSVAKVLADLFSEDMQERLSNLRSIRFQYPEFMAIPCDKRLGTWTQVDSVHFYGDYGFETADGLWDWVALFAGCGSLSFVGNICETPITREVAPPPDPPRVHVRSLIFDGCSDSIWWLPPALASPHLRVDKLAVILSEFSYHPPLLHIVSPKLQELLLTRRSHSDVPRLKLADDSCPELHSATLHLEIHSSQEVALALLDAQVILRASPNLSRIHFRLPPVAPDQVTLVTQAWGEMDTLLAGTVDHVFIRLLPDPHSARDGPTYPEPNLRLRWLRTAGIRPYHLPLRLVCSSWHDYTSRLFFGLFKHIVLRGDDHAVRFCALVRASPRAAILVQSLVAIHRLSVTAGLADLLSEDMQRRLPSLRSLKFQHPQFSAIPREKQMGTWAQLEQVRFDGRFVFETADGLWDWVALFAGCRSLSFAGRIWNTPIPKGVVPPSDPPRVHLRSLTFIASWTIEQVVPAALASPNLRVDKLTLVLYDPSCFTSLLRVLCSKLQEPRLSRANFRDATPLPLADGCCTELHTGTLNLLRLDTQEMALVLSDIRVILRASSNLSRIQFLLPPMVRVHQVTLTAQSWGELDTLLAGTVDRVCIYLPISPDDAEDPGQLALKTLSNEGAIRLSEDGGPSAREFLEDSYDEDNEGARAKPAQAGRSVCVIRRNQKVHAMTERRDEMLLSVVLLLFAPALSTVHAIGQRSCVVFQPSKTVFSVVSNGKAAPLMLSADEWPGVQRTTQDFADDIQRVTGVRPEVSNGTAAHPSHDICLSSLIDVSEIENRWEAFLSQVFMVPSGCIIGADKRGTIFALYDHSEQIGVSPWYWWADVPMTRGTSLFVEPSGCFHGSPTVKYRDIFLNDEQPAPQNWAAAKFTANGTGIALTNSPFNRFFYGQLSMSAFGVDDPLNQFTADYYGIVMGTSHEEPMMRSIPVEWGLFGNGPKRAIGVSAAAIHDFWVAGAKRAAPFENMWTVGMRGNGDEPIVGSGPVSRKSGLCTERSKDIMTKDFRCRTISLFSGPTITDWGNVRRYPLPSERNGTGGAGVYYHIDHISEVTATFYPSHSTRSKTHGTTSGSL